MAEMTAPKATLLQTLREDPNKALLAFVALAFLASWGWLIRVAYPYWGEDSYYNFGWFVPLVVLYFLYARIKTARIEIAPTATRLSVLAFLAIASTGAIAITALRMLSEANFGFPLLICLHGIILLGICYAALILFSGWSTWRSLAFPLFLMLVALPWPSRVEIYVIQSLTHIVTQLVVAVINLIGYPAQAMGNTIRVLDEHVGVDEACSGIRSLQALIVVALCLGEFFNFRIGRRLLMLAAAVAISMLFNGLRAILLTLVTINGTEEKFDFWHDFLGNFNAIICGILLFGVAELLEWLLGRTERTEPRIRLPAISCKQWKPIAALTILPFAIPEGVVESYYQIKEHGLESLPVLDARWPDNDLVTYQMSEIPEDAAEVRNYDHGEQVNLFWNNGLRATAIFYGYIDGGRMDAIYGYFHRPEVCLPGTGAELTARMPDINVHVLGRTWPVQHLEFTYPQSESRGRATRLQVFWLIWDHQTYASAGKPVTIGNLQGRIQPMLEGRREFSRQILLLYFPEETGGERLRATVTSLIESSLVEAEAAR